MIVPKTLLLAAAASLSLGACAATTKTHIPAPEAALGPETAPVPAPQGEGIIIKGPQGTNWVKPGALSQSYRSDIESCYSFARARVAHDERIDNDSGAAFDSGASSIGLTDLRGRMDRFARNNQRASLFGDCMIAKGYSRK